MSRSIFLFIILSSISVFTASAQQQDEKNNPYYKPSETGKVKVSDAQWKKVLTPKVYNIMREKGTETANTGPYVHNNKNASHG